eukprot:3537815-Rhodomonas_salina.2
MSGTNLSCCATSKVAVGEVGTATSLRASNAMSACLRTRRKGTALVKGESRAPIGTKPFLEYNAEAIEHFYDRNPIPG